MTSLGCINRTPLSQNNSGRVWYTSLLKGFQQPQNIIKYFHNLIQFYRMETKKRYTDEELEEFRTIVNDKLAIAKSDYDETMKILMNKNTNDVNDTSPTYKALEEGSSNQTKEELVQMAQRQQKFIQALQAALVRINNKTYGIDRITGELIPKERLRIVPHATLSVASKMANKNH